ncbi:hypothetical protein UFOVP1146_333 [uncultured Caudovirales phage]|uniref:Uncharacterized protein n=1 Tax=uncultured Caudovirales phage TaxID=2100421 RepID=A0A6J5NY50_9CAUD|nr:hypothetical protein UFOVP812_246 [uncultured Caudovirales phage]CAB4165783.1 hypothetical protein UFOVP818_319 [uncultured Caudovirales phage]CAB4186987.1 hypothetical protein UFOVP1146_333 [uncultured Caudovirales phage]CAB4221262.1 hypothetical protein UFOVP1638_232 [uncultured Caudovirales phage]
MVVRAHPGEQITLNVVSVLGGIDVMGAWDLCKVFVRVRFSHPPTIIVLVNVEQHSYNHAG